MLKELNAKALLHIHNTRVGVLNDMFSFTEKLMAHLSTQCICCNARGFSDCPLNAQITTDDALARTPVNAKLSGVRLDMSDNEGSTSRQSAGSSKRPPLAPDSDAISKKKKPSDVRGESAHSNLCRSSDNIIEQAVYIFNQIASNYNSDQDDPNGPAVFGKLTKVLPRRHPIFHYSYAANPNPWRAGRAPPPLKPDIADELAKALMQIPSEEIERYWIVHDTPSLVCVRGHALREQLAGDGNFEHELMCVALRRYSQVDSEVDQGCPYLNWRIILEADFATLVLAGKDYLRSVHVQSQLIGGHIKFSIACCQFFLAPAMVHDCWVLYMWDMVARAIHVFDPLAGSRGPSSERKQSLQFVASRLHDALFHCLHEYFARWPKQKDSWSTIYPKIVDTLYTSTDSGPIVLHLVRYYDGERLKFPITKYNLEKTRFDALHEVMKLRENRSPLPGDVLWDALAPSQFSFGEFLNEEQA